MMYANGIVGSVVQKMKSKKYCKSEEIDLRIDLPGDRSKL